MSQQDIVVLTDAMLITCIVQRGAANKVVEEAMRAGAHGATIYYARGTGVRQRHLGVLGIAISAEKEMVHIVVPSEQADRVFESMYEAAQIDTPGMGILYMTAVEKMATYVPPAVVAKYVRD
jgi:nitrogen regulatory protein P-II 1